MSRACTISLVFVLLALCLPAPVSASQESATEFRSSGKATRKLQKAVEKVRDGDCDRLEVITEYAGEYVDASYELAMLFAEGVCVEQDLARAIDLSTWNCQRRGDHDSCDFLGRQILRSDPSAPDLLMALGYARFGAYAGHPPSMQSLGWLYAMEDMPFSDVDGALYWYHRAADSGLSAPMYNLFFIYASRGPRFSPDKAREWLERAAEAGSPSAWLALSRHYERGSVLFDRDTRKAVHWREKFRATGADEQRIQTPGLQ